MSSIDVAVAMIGVQALSRLIVACGVSSSFKEIPGIDRATGCLKHESWRRRVASFAPRGPTNRSYRAQSFFRFTGERAQMRS